MHVRAEALGTQLASAHPTGPKLPKEWEHDKRRRGTAHEYRRNAKARKGVVSVGLAPNLLGRPRPGVLLSQTVRQNIPKCKARLRWQLALPGQGPSVPCFTSTMGVLPDLYHRGPAGPYTGYSTWQIMHCGWNVEDSRSIFQCASTSWHHPTKSLIRVRVCRWRTTAVQLACWKTQCATSFCVSLAQVIRFPPSINHHLIYE